MTLSFSTVINGKPNYFIEKIWKVIQLLVDYKVKPLEQQWYEQDFVRKFGRYWDIPVEEILFKDTEPKLHTIRLDEKNRWRPGMDIHMVVKPKGRFSAGFQFAPVIKCVSVQEIRIVSAHKFVSVGTDCGNIMHVLGDEEKQQLAINDGFNSVEDFFAYFNKDFTGKLIHWTDLKY